MPEFTRIYDLRHAPELNMTPEEYIQYQHGILKQDLFNRLPVDKHKLLGL